MAFSLLPITRFHGYQVIKRHYRSLKMSLWVIENVTIGLNSILKNSIFKRGAFPYLVWEEGQKAN